MTLTFRRKIVLTSAAIAFLMAILATPLSSAGADRPPEKSAEPGLVTLPPGASFYRVAGDFQRNGKPAAAPASVARIDRRLTIMTYQVTAADYQRCAAEGGCARVSNDNPSDRPAVNVSWRDATAYAAWLSRKTGRHYRLPTDEEWAFAAGSRYRDDAVSLDSDDPSARWLARYEAESNRKTGIDSRPKTLGHFGANEHGVFDLAGNVWEWTDTCFSRIALGGGNAPATVNCGVRVVEGEHRAYVTDFIRDARAGGCAAGIPPANLGFRLVREDLPWHRRMLPAGLIDEVTRLLSLRPSS
jgi:formylglycine-generating enzyme required for sulfatase activity